jgi:hypothetical protein
MYLPFNVSMTEYCKYRAFRPLARRLQLYPLAVRSRDAPRQGPATRVRVKPRAIGHFYSHREIISISSAAG